MGYKVFDCVVCRPGFICVADRSWFLNGKVRLIFI